MAGELDSSPHGEKARLKLDDWAKVAASFALSLYGIGLVAVNGYLFGRGVSDFALVRARFIYAGALICALAAIAYALPEMAMKNTRELIAERKAKGTFRGWRRLSSLMSWWYGFWFPVLLFFGILASHYGSFEDGALTLPVLLGVAILLTITSYLVVWTFIYIIGSIIGSMRTRDASPAFVGLSVFIILLLGVGYIPLFMNTIYSRVPEQFGGGRPRTVRLLLTNEAKNQIEDLYPGVRGEVSSPCVEMLYEGTDFYLVDLGDRTTIQLQRDLVLGVVITDTESPCEHE